MRPLIRMTHREKAEDIGEGWWPIVRLISLNGISKGMGFNAGVEGLF